MIDFIDPKAQTALQPARPPHRRRLPAAALSLILGLQCLAAPAQARQDTPSQQTPAPIIRVRPRPQAPSPQNAPPDAAPLAPRTPRPRPISPQSLTGSPASTGQASTPASRPRPTPATSATSQTTAPKIPHTPTQATTPTPKLSTTLNRNLIVLDPAHGGTDSGSRIGENLLEKDVTLALAFRLRALLTARGFTVILTRDSDAATAPNSPTPLTLDDRAGIANHARAAACLLLHATSRGSGVHLYSSELDPAPGEAATLPWLTAQAAWIPASQQLERSLASALGRSHIALVSSTASVRPVDSLTCPALVVELAPQSDDPHSVNDAAYQESIAQALAGALLFWQNQVQSPPKLTAAPTTPHTPHHHITSPATPAQEPQP